MENEPPIRYYRAMENWFIPENGQILRYLYNKLANTPRAIDVLKFRRAIISFDFYGEKQPWEMWERFERNYYRTCEDLFFFTELKNDRMSGFGTWIALEPNEPINDFPVRGIPLWGNKQRFQYDSELGGRWVMYEYSLDHILHDDVLPCIDDDDDDDSRKDYVICQLRKIDVERGEESPEVSDQSSSSSI